MKKMLQAASFAALAAAAAATQADPTEQELRQVLHQDFHARGIAKMDRVDQDAVQRVCTESRNNPPAGVAKMLEADQMKTLHFPSGSLLGDWKRGEKLAESGHGMTWKDKPGSAGGGCYNCHELAPTQPSFGTVGPSLKAFGRLRGDGAEIQRYVYGKIYNAKAYNLCSNMPRFGESSTLTEQQIKDLTAYLLDPASPVNH